MKTRNTFQLIICTMLLSSCATIFTGTKTRVTFDSNIESASELEIDGKKYYDVNFPYKTKVKDGFKPSMVEANQKGYEPLEFRIDKKYNHVTWLNILFGGIIGYGIDVATGAVMRTEKKEYFLRFEPKQEVVTNEVKTVKVATPTEQTTAPMQKKEYYIIGIDGESIMLDVIQPHVKVGDVVNIYTGGGHVVHPVTNERIEKERTLLCALKIVSTHSEYSIAKPLAQNIASELKTGMIVSIP